MVLDKRIYTRYPLRCECILATESGRTFGAEIMDLSAEGAKIKADAGINLNEGDVIFLNIKCKYRIKAKAEIRWLKYDDRFTIFGVKFVEMSMKDRDSLAKILSEMALSRLEESYWR